MTIASLETLLALWTGLLILAFGKGSVADVPARGVDPGTEEPLGLLVVSAAPGPTLAEAGTGKVGTVVKLNTPAQLPVLRAFAQESDSVLSTVTWKLLT